MTKSIGFLMVTTLVAVLQGSTVSSATEVKECKEFIAIGSTEVREMHYIDVDGNGTKNAGDRLIGHRALLNSSGKRIGDRYFTTILHEVSASGDDIRRTAEVINAFSEGTIFTTKERIGGKDLPSNIHGGTGEYAGATGTVKIVRDGEATQYHFRINCPSLKDS